MHPVLSPLLLVIGLFVTACGASEPDRTASGAAASDEAAESASTPAADAEAAQVEEPEASDDVGTGATAGGTGEATDAELSALRDKLAKRVPNLDGSEIRATPLDGIYEISRGMAVGYVTADGRYLLEGDLIDLATGRQITEERRREARKVVLEEAAERSITFGGDEADHLVTVFTDIDCGYCRKLHSELDDYTDRGIGIRYLLYPRSGKDSDAYRKAVATWCSDDRKEALTRAKQGQDPGTKSCDNPVDQHLLAGRKLGLRGTPMMVLPSGELIQGYVPAERLISRLESTPEQEPLEN
ncbi:DsbC family protein [Algiphilus sp.]|uniref:DsbC family protein n=1 Tax=Algiphilus sp. TaxID=1872431 RepID=UPI003C65C1EE